MRPLPASTPPSHLPALVPKPEMEVVSRVLVRGSMMSTAGAWSGMQKMRPSGLATPPHHLPEPLSRGASVVVSAVLVAGSMMRTWSAACGTA